MYTVDYNGSHCYLFEAYDPKVKVHVAYTGKDMGLAEGDLVRLRGKMDCEKVFGIDESFQDFWVSYRAEICTLKELDYGN
jgi:hypothetical protein